jgi:hypothetical protein
MTAIRQHFTALQGLDTPTLSNSFSTAMERCVRTKWYNTGAKHSHLARVSLALDLVFPPLAAPPRLMIHRKLTIVRVHSNRSVQQQVDDADESGSTPLHLASWRGQVLPQPPPSQSHPALER